MDDCIRNNVLKEFLLKHRGEVTDLVLSQYDEEAYIKSEKKISFEDGYEQCRNELQPVIESQNGQIKNQNGQINRLNTHIKNQETKLQEQDIRINKLNETIRLLSEQLQQLQKKLETL